MRYADSIDRRDAAVSTRASWVVEGGRAGAQEA
jgi:hypothetical protein